MLKDTRNILNEHYNFLGSDEESIIREDRMLIKEKCHLNFGSTEDRVFMIHLSEH